jgi:hypothetical protein
MLPNDNATKVNFSCEGYDATVKNNLRIFSEFRTHFLEEHPISVLGDIFVRICSMKADLSSEEFFVICPDRTVGPMLIMKFRV